MANIPDDPSTRELLRFARGERGPSGVRRGSGLLSSGLPWILPALVVSAGLIYYCIGYTAYISTLEWNGVSPIQIFVGLENYAKLLQDPVFWAAIWHTAVFFVVTFTFQVLLGMAFAVLLHSKVRLSVLYRVVIFVPVVIAPATMAPVFREMLAPTGQFNEILRFVGLSGVARAWLAEPRTALLGVIAIAIWQSTGVSFILYFAAVGQIDNEVLEAARIDGARNLRVVRSIVWPGVRGTTVALAILAAISSLKLFDIPYLVTSGGPEYGTEFLGVYIFQVSFVQNELGYGAAISIVLLVLAVGMAITLSVRGARRA
jgi:ABC-type sugar transport system permease subunit